MGEEHGLTPGAEGAGTWVVDPIDGTQPFLLGLPTWCVSIAYVRDGRAEIGVLHNPATGDLYAARAGHGATHNGVPISVREATSLSDGLTGVGCSPRTEPDMHIHAWDCLAALCLIEEAGGRVSPFLADFGVTGAGPLVAGAPGVFDQLEGLIRDVAAR